MNNIRIITDSASDMPAGYRDDVTVVPLHVRFGTEEYLDGVNLTHREFYEKLIENDELPTTSKEKLEQVTGTFDFEVSMRRHAKPESRLL